MGSHSIEPDVPATVAAVVGQILARARDNAANGRELACGSDPERTLLDLGVVQRTLGVAEPNIISGWMTPGLRKKRYTRRRRAHRGQV